MHIKTQKGFTIIEFVLSISLLALMLAYVAEFSISQTTGLMDTANRQEALGDMRFALSRMNYELMRIDPSADLTTITEGSIYFTTSEGEDTNYRFDTVPGGYMGIYRGDVLMAGYIDTFRLEYFDSLGVELNPLVDDPSEVVRIKITMINDNDRNEKKIPIGTSIVPRSVLGYENFN